MKKKLFRDTYKFVCSNYGEFSHILYKYCEKCGTINTVHNAVRKDYA